MAVSTDSSSHAGSYRPPRLICRRPRRPACALCLVPKSGLPPSRCECLWPQLWSGTVRHGRLVTILRRGACRTEGEITRHMHQKAKPIEERRHLRLCCGHHGWQGIRRMGKRVTMRALWMILAVKDPSTPRSFSIGAAAVDMQGQVPGPRKAHHDSACILSESR